MQILKTQTIMNINGQLYFKGKEIIQNILKKSKNKDKSMIRPNI